MSARPPLAGAATWQLVMQAAGHQCQCTGHCGNQHAKTQGRCDRVHGGHAHRHGGGIVRLLAAPADPARLALPPHRAAALPVGELAAWCPSCHDQARRAAAAATRATATDVGAGADVLF